MSQHTQAQWPPPETAGAPWHSRRLLFAAGEPAAPGYWREVTVREVILFGRAVLISDDEEAIYCTHCRRFVPIIEVTAAPFSDHSFDKRSRTVIVETVDYGDTSGLPRRGPRRT